MKCYLLPPTYFIARMQEPITSKYFFHFVLLLAIIIICQPRSYDAFASSPSFDLQGIDDEPNDWSLSETSYSGVKNPINKTACSGGQQNLPDILAVKYFSDGRTLNATLWLSSPFEEPSLQRVRNYEMLIDVDSAYDIGQDYQVVISADALTNGWTRIVRVSSPTPGENKIIDPGESKILNQTNNYTGFYEKGKNFVDLSLDLSAISSPNQYSILFIASEIFFEKGSLCSILDITDLVHIPPPEFAISASPSSVTLRPGQEKNMELQLKSSANLNSNVSLSTNQIPGIMLGFISKTALVPPNGVVSIPLNIKALENATVRPYTLPIFADISFPTTITNRLTGGLIYNTPAAKIMENSDLTVTVIEPLSIPEIISSTLNTYGSPIKEIVALLTTIGSVGGICAWVIKKVKRKRMQKHPEDTNNH
jgi:hypothetical protein